MSLREAMWQAKPESFALAKEAAREALKKGDHMSADSIILTECNTLLGSPTVGLLRKFKLGIVGLLHAWCMFTRPIEMNHNQLDVWLQFMLKFRSRVPIFKGTLNKMLIEGAAQETAKAGSGKPHQVALAYMTYAEVVYAVYLRNTNQIETNIKIALSQEESIRAEADQPQGLRQLVRIWRKAGELYGKLGDKEKKRHFLEKAFRLAQETNTQDQIDKIYELLVKL